MLRMFSLFELGKFRPGSWGWYGSRLKKVDMDTEFRTDVEENDSVGWKQK